MVSNRNENIQAINQGECTGCGSSNDNYKVVDTDHSSDRISYELVCDCGETTTVSITPNGLSTDDSISHRNASWNRGEQSEELEEGEEGEEDEDDGTPPERGETERLQ